MRDALLGVDAAQYATPGLADEHMLVGSSSTQLTHTLFTTLLDPGDRVELFDPSHANYGPQLVLAVVNFPPKRIGPFWPECLVTGVANADGDIVLVTPDQAAPNGVRLI